MVMMPPAVIGIIKMIGRIAVIVFRAMARGLAMRMVMVVLVVVLVVMLVVVVVRLHMQAIK